MAGIPQRGGAALVAALSPEPDARDADFVLWRATRGDPVARAGEALALQTELLGGGYYWMAPSPTHGQFAIGGANGVLQFDAETLALRAAWTLSDLRGVEALAFSPDGRYLAVSTVSVEQVALVALRVTGEHRGIPEGANEDADVKRLGLVSPVGIMEGGEYTNCLAFTPNGQTLFAGCSYQGGTSIAIADVADRDAKREASAGEDALRNPRELWRSDLQTPLAEFCDRVGSLSVSPSGRMLALYETAQLSSRSKSLGWRGVLSVADAPFETVRWSTPIDVRLTGDTRPIELFGARTHGGYFTDAVFLSEEEIVCGATAGKLLCFDVRTGELTRTIKLPAPYQVAEVWRLAMGMAPSELWCSVILDNIYQVLCLDPRQ